MRRLTLFLILAGLVAAVAPSEGGSRDLRFYGLGPRVGVSFDPGQFVMGGHADWGDLFPNTSWLFPVIEVGLGSSRTTTSIGTDVLFRFRDRWGQWTPYLGGELDLIITNFDRSQGGDTETDLGLMGVLGIQKAFSRVNTLGFEAKIKIVDAPLVKIMATLTFGG